MKPVIFINNGMAEGVYAASGSSSASIGISVPILTIGGHPDNPHSLWILTK